jgi:hypothetical protein
MVTLEGDAVDHHLASRRSGLRLTLAGDNAKQQNSPENTSKVAYFFH